MTNTEELTAIAKALYDEKRQKIIKILQNGETCASVLLKEMKLPQSTLAFHMKILCDSGLVTGRYVGKWKHYKLNPAKRDRAVKLMQNLLTDKAEKAEMKKEAK